MCEERVAFASPVEKHTHETNAKRCAFVEEKSENQDGRHHHSAKKCITYPFGVLVGQYRTNGFDDSTRCEVLKEDHEQNLLDRMQYLRGNHFQAEELALSLLLDERSNLRINFLQ